MATRLGPVYTSRSAVILTAIGMAVIGTALFGSGGGSGQSSSTRLMPSLAHTAQTATVVNLAFVLAAWLCAFGLPGPWPRIEPRRTSSQPRLRRQ